MQNSYIRYKAGRYLAVASLWLMFILCASGAAAQIWCHPWMSASNSAVLPIQTSDRWKEKPHGNPTFFFRKSSFTGNIVLACPQRSHYYRGGGGDIVCACELLLHFKWASPFTLAGISTITFNCSCPRKLLLLFTSRRQHVFLTVLRRWWVRRSMWAFFFSYFKYILLYCKIQNNNKAVLFTNVQNLRLYYIFWL